MFLVFNTKEEAIARNVEAGKEMGLSYYLDIPEEDKDIYTQYVWPMVEEDGEDPRCALDIEGAHNLLTEEETSELQSLPEDWEIIGMDE